jgi:hypothetical protein
LCKSQHRNVRNGGGGGGECNMTTPKVCNSLSTNSKDSKVNVMLDKQLKKIILKTGRQYFLK